MLKFPTLILGLLMVVGCNNPQFSVAEVSPPKDETIPNSLLDNFVRKSFVNLLGREPLADEEARFIAELKKEKFSIQSRLDALDKIMGFPEYNENLYRYTREYLLNFIYHPSFLDKTLEIWRNLPQADDRDAEIERLEKLKSIPKDLQSGKLNATGLQRRLTHNSFYDFVNMGTENFVVSCFENYLLRFPTEYEKREGKKMTDGKDAVLFGERGNSKSSFLDIIFSNKSYSEGQVRLLFRQFLYREPDSREIALYSLRFSTNKDFRGLQKEILSGDEYAGLTDMTQSAANEKQ